MPYPSAKNGISLTVQAQFGPIYAHTALLNFRDEMYLIAGSRHVGGRCRELPEKWWPFFAPLKWQLLVVGGFKYLLCSLLPGEMIQLD